MESGTVIALAALGMSSISLGWQILSWRRSGPVVSVTASQIFPVYGPRLGDLHIGVAARNTGRAPVTATGWGLMLPTGGKIVSTSPLSWSAPLPHRLEPGTEATWFVLTDEIKRQCADLGVRYQDLRAFVNLANGRTVLARRRGIGLQ